MTLQEAVERAVERLASDGIEGYLLRDFTSLMSNNWVNMGHDQRKWLPPPGTRLVELGAEPGSDADVWHTYYALLGGGETVYLRHVARRFEADNLLEVDPDKVPEYLLAALARG